MNTKDEAFEWMGVLCKTICICAYLTRPRNASSPSLSLSISRHGSARLDVSFSSRCWLLFHPSIHNHPQAQQQSREWKGRAGLGWIAHHPAGQSSPINRHSLQASRYDSTMGFSFGNFDRICETAALIPCAMLADSTGTGIEPVCYARNVEINGTILFQPGECPLREDWSACRSDDAVEGGSSSSRAITTPLYTVVKQLMPCFSVRPPPQTQPSSSRTSLQS